MHEHRLQKKGMMNNEQGYSLLEILIAISIFAVGILAIGSMQTAALMGNTSSRGVTEAVNLAQERVEQLMAIPYTPGSINAALDPAQNANHVATDGDYTIRWTVTSTAHADMDNPYLDINVTVTWPARAGVTGRVSFNFVKTEEM